jgi:hypothetical protein
MYQWINSKRNLLEFCNDNGEALTVLDIAKKSVTFNFVDMEAKSLDEIMTQFESVRSALYMDDFLTVGSDDNEETEAETYAEACE